jgi:hypothetical protein
MDLVSFTNLIISMGIKAKLKLKIFFPIKTITWPWKHNKIWYKTQWHGRIRVSKDLKYWEIIEDMVITKKSKTKFKIGNKKLIKIVLQTMVL